MTPSQTISPADAALLLAWYAEMGVDVALEDEGQDRFAEPARSPAQPRAEQPPHTGQTPARQPISASGERALPGLDTPAPTPSAAAALVRPHEASVADARAAARAATSLDELRGLLENYDGVALRRSATQLVFADGNPAARIMLVGEAPGRDEDLEGLPFVGRAGQLLDRMLAAIGLDRRAVYIANVVPWRPPGNRTPTVQEVQLCLPFIKRQIELVDPDVLVLLGGSAAAALMDTRDGILKMRGKWLDYDTGTCTIRALPTLHPAYLLRTPLQKRLAWRDFRTLQATISGA